MKPIQDNHHRHAKNREQTSANIFGTIRDRDDIQWLSRLTVFLDDFTFDDIVSPIMIYT